MLQRVFFFGRSLRSYEVQSFGSYTAATAIRTPKLIAPHAIAIPIVKGIRLFLCFRDKCQRWRRRLIPPSYWCQSGGLAMFSVAFRHPQAAPAIMTKATMIPIISMCQTGLYLHGSRLLLSSADGSATFNGVSL